MVSFLLLYQLHYYSSIKPICNVSVFPFLIFQDFLTWKLGSSKVTVQGELKSISFITSSPKGVIYPHAKCPLIPSIHLQWIYSIPTGYVWVLSFRLFLFFQMSVFTRLSFIYLYFLFESWRLILYLTDNFPILFRVQTSTSCFFNCWAFSGDWADC